MLSTIRITLSVILGIILSYNVLAQMDKDVNQIDSLWSLLDEDGEDQLSPLELITIANKYLQSNPELSMAFGVKAINSAISEENSSIKTKILIDHGYNLNKIGDHTLAYNTLLEGLQLAKINADTSSIIYANNALGIYFNDRGDNFKATEHYSITMRLAELIKDTLGIIRPHVNLMGIYLEQNRPEKSLEYGLKGLKLAIATNELRAEGFLSNNIAQSYIAQNSPDLAIPYLQRALEISTQREDPETMARNNSNLCNVFMLEGDLAQAKYHCDIANDLLAPLSNPRSKLLHSIVDGSYLLKAGRINEALSKANYASELGQEASLNMHMSGVYELLYKIYKAKGDTDKALEMFERFSEIRYGTASADATAQIALNESNYFKLVESNEELNRRTQMAEFENQSYKSTSQRNWAMSMALGLGLLGLFSFIGFRNKAKTNKLLERKNHEIEQQKEELDNSLAVKETLLKEIHHRVKNNLQIISSLLNLQAKKVDDSKVLESLEEGKNRVEAMSLIHQNLYQSDDIASVDMKVYLDQLMGNLSKSFNFSKNAISYRVDITDVNFDIDTAIPIGLIINELVTNAAKHAFIDRASGEIIVSIKKQGVKYLLSVEDNGVGMKDTINLGKPTSLGFKLVKTLGVKQLSGNLEVLSENGTRINLLFNKLI